MENTIYYDALFSGLIPCRILTEYGNNREIELTANSKNNAYKKGEILTVPRHYVVKIARRTHYNTWVTTA